MAVPQHTNIPKVSLRHLSIRMKKLFLFCFVFLSHLASSLAQDNHLTQFYASPLSLNPALTGAFEGRYRVGAVYRDQWRGILENPIKTFSVGGDFRFKAPFRTVREDALGLGLLFFNDKTGVIDFSTTQIAISMAYHKALGSGNRQFLSLGLQGGLTQRNVNYESLNFHDEFDGINGYNLGTGEDLPPNNFSFTDYNVGLNYTAKFGRTGRVFLGAAMHHFTSPRVSFVEDNTGEGDKLYTKYSGQFSAHIPLKRNNRVSVQPRVLFATQGPHLQINAGTNMRFVMGQYGGSALHLGTWARPVRNNDGFGLDAVVALLGIEVNNVLFGLSYDLNLKALGANQRQGALEISISYLGNYENEEILCPKF